MNNRIYLYLCWVVVTLKIFVFISYFYGFGISFGGGSDANMYHAAAIGEINVTVNIWPVILHFLFDYGLYNREVVTFLLFFISMFIIPLLFLLLIMDEKKTKDKVYYLSFFWIVLYPTIYFFSNDIFRDVVMVFLFLITSYICKVGCLSYKFKFKILYFTIAFLLSYVLYLFRPYLGFSIAVAIVFYPLLFMFKRMSLVLLLYFIFCTVAATIGLFEPLMEYRSGFELAGGGSTLGLQLTGNNPILFIPKFILSYLFQFFGLFLVSPAAIFVFVTESIVVIYAFVFLCKNKKYFNGFIAFLICFAVVYNTVWIIANDNLGTAVRLRIYSYIAIVVAGVITYRNKEISKGMGN
ncbi:hypothetical protein C9J19_18630 [Photobacterium phosphoreum]|uniref:hypothetical protein n=1 Tax=Photobacterium phosphoreum TaxID=659 RepID=UPI000D152F98|nr:hypothetical protein [Photobacterium phosphoreum]PSW25652.1 hypothetical protein C9J19_18630 [Photobacterium phosphoreum]